MAIVVTPEILEESAYAQDENGRMDQRSFLISGLTPGPGIRIDAAKAKGMPQYGDGHPKDRSLFAARIALRPYLTSQDTLRGTVTYRPSDATNLFTPFVQFRGSTTNIETSLDVNGNVIEVEYSPDNGDTTTKSVARVPASEVEGTLTITRVEAIAPNFALQLLNFMNAGVFQGKPATTWMLRSVEFELFLVRSGWRVSYTFDYRARGWSEFAIYIDPLTGFSPSGIKPGRNLSATSGNGWVRANVRGIASFAGLGLPRVF